MDALLKDEIINELEQLDYDKQAQVLDFVKALSLKIKGVKGKDLLDFSGSIEQDELEIIKNMIEEHCESVELNDW